MIASATIDAMRKLAERLMAMNPRGDRQIGHVSVAIGAVYALIRAAELDYSDRTGLPSWADVRKAGQPIAAGRKIPTSGRFVAGYYFNDVLFRVDVGFENALRDLTGLKDERIEIVAEKGSRIVGRSLLQHWHPVRKEVNALKHRNPEQKNLFPHGHGFRWRTAARAVTDLVTLLERYLVPGGR